MSQNDESYSVAGVFRHIYTNNEYIYANTPVIFLKSNCNYFIWNIEVSIDNCTSQNSKLNPVASVLYRRYMNNEIYKARETHPTVYFTNIISTYPSLVSKHTVYILFWLIYAVYLKNIS